VGGLQSLLSDAETVIAGASSLLGEQNGATKKKDEVEEAIRQSIRDDMYTGAAQVAANKQAEIEAQLTARESGVPGQEPLEARRSSPKDLINPGADGASTAKLIGAKYAEGTGENTVKQAEIPGLRSFTMGQGQRQTFRG
jgi:hypothetical protein